jgi:hypothetical protein
MKFIELTFTEGTPRLVNLDFIREIKQEGTDIVLIYDKGIKSLREPGDPAVY